jgi:hypothetical protein
MGTKGEAFAEQFEAKVEEATAVLVEAHRCGLEENDSRREVDGRRDRAPRRRELRADHSHHQDDRRRQDAAALHP